MKRLLAAIALSTSLAVVSVPSLAGGYSGYGYHHKYRGYHGHYGRYGHRGHHRHHGHDGAYVAAGIIGGALLLGVLLSAPRYYHPPAPAYRAPPRARICERDRVYRYLPDGRVQWGVRTRCY